jgi:hypothetical protein
MKALSAVLKKADAHCEARKIDRNALLQARLFPDMFPLIRQVQLVTDFAKGCGARLSGIAIPSYPDEEKSFEDLQARLSRTIDFLRTLNDADFADAATRSITLRAGGKDVTFSGADYLNSYVLPNFYFHYATAYNILRHNGVELGKGDFMGRAG